MSQKDFNGFATQVNMPSIFEENENIEVINNVLINTT